MEIFEFALVRLEAVSAGSFSKQFGYTLLFSGIKGQLGL